MSLRVAFLGLGIMGLPMARNIAAAGFPLTVWNRTAAKTAEVPRAKAAEHPGDAVAEADIVVTMLADGATVEDVLFESGAAAEGEGKLFVDMSSIEPARARDHAELLAALGARSVDAPVSGGEKGAVEARLAIMAGGDAADVAAADPVFAALGRVTHVGPHGTGQVAKLANQVIVGVTIGAVAEALTLAARAGADPDQVRAALAGGFAGSPILELHGKRMTSGDYAPGAHAATQLKDLDNALELAGGLGLRLPLSETTQGAFAELAGPMGKAELDHAAYHLWLAARNGSGEG